MKEEFFDKKIKELADSCRQTPDPEVWDRIESALDRKRRMRLWRNAARFCAAAAVAAGLFATVLLDNSGQEAVQEYTAEAVEPSVPVRISVEEQDVPLRALPGISAGAVAVREDRVLSMPEPLSVSEEDVPEEEEPVNVSGLPSIYDQAARMEYIAMTSDEDGNTASERRKSSFSFAAGGSMSASRASGNVDFSQPNYSAGAGSQTSSKGIVPVSEPRHYFPVSVGIEARYSFLNDRLGVGLGLNYTFLNSRYEALVDRQYQASVDQSVHYLGVPLTFYVNILSGDRLFFYADAGCMMERAVKVSYEMTDLSSVTYQKDGKASGLQWSANVGIGLEYRFLDFMGVYVDPRLTYFFDCDQPYSVRSEQPLQFNLQMGFRFHI